MKMEDIFLRGFLAEMEEENNEQPLFLKWKGEENPAGGTEDNLF